MPSGSICPAIVVITPVAASTRRTRSLPVSTMNRSPSPSTATPEGPLTSAVVAPSPSKAKFKSPVTVVITSGRRVDAADAADIGVGDEQDCSQSPSTATPNGLFSLGAGRQAAVAREALVSVAGDGRDDAARRVDPADDAVERIGDEQIAEPVDRHVPRLEQLGAGRRAAVAREPGRAVARDGRDHAGRRVDPADTAVGCIGDEQIAEPVDHHCTREAQLGAGRLRHRRPRSPGLRCRRRS